MSTIKNMTSESLQNEDEEEPQEGEELELNNYLRYSSTSALEMSLCI
ncbi:hypothetical protein Vi05172_g7927 [Venturia inaequalis]|nr:hypothetical protein Vi05172_g7927 [Venturia inaequalis]